MAVLDVFKKHTKTLALAGGTALELFYLKHRFSKDLDFFSPAYNVKEIEKIICAIGKVMKTKVKIEGEFTLPNYAKVRFCSLPVKGIKDRLKIDFVEDVLFQKPALERHNGVPVYQASQIYLQKIITITGARLTVDDIGKTGITGRNEVRDVIDLYYLSKNVSPLHHYLKTLPVEQQRGMVQWYRTFSRMEFKLNYLDYEVYDTGLDAVKIIRYLEGEIRSFMNEVLHEH